jgi:hypothetical protein
MDIPYALAFLLCCCILCPCEGVGEEEEATFRFLRADARLPPAEEDVGVEEGTMVVEAEVVGDGAPRVPVVVGRPVEGNV